MDGKDGMTQVYREMVLWADIVLLATPIRWGNASSLYYKMAERLNTVQNQITLNNNILIKNKVAAFIITGGQDNINPLQVN
jgi:multimeric flavodoxin WrbA